MKIPNELNELKNLKQWVAHKNKIPRNPFTGGNAMANEPETWGTFDVAERAVVELGLDGVGFQFGVLDPQELRVSGIDLDHVVKSDGSLEPFAEEIVRQMNSYTELSPSGTGLHILCKTKLPNIGRKKSLPNGCGLEMYNYRHYFTVTGKIYGEAKRVEERTAEYGKIYEKYFMEDKQPTVDLKARKMPNDFSDHELWGRMFDSRNGYEIRALFNGDTSRYGGDDSRADLALCSHLAFWTGHDERRMDEMFRESGLMRPKWDERHGAQTYGAMTIKKALNSVDMYNPDYFSPQKIEREHSNNSEVFEKLSIILPEGTQEGLISELTVQSYIDGTRGDWAIDKDLGRFQKYMNRKTGFSNIDEKSSLYPGLYVLGAISSLGKTTFVHQLADQLAKSGEHVIFFSLEQTTLELVTKGLSRLTAQEDMRFAVSSIDIRRGVNTPIVKNARQIYSQIAKHEVILECSFEMTIEGILETVQRYISETGIAPIVIVDYLQVIAPMDIRMMTKDAVDSHVRALKKLQKENDLVVILVSSLNRQNYLTPIDYESFKESGGIEYTADVIWGLQLSVMNEDIFDKDKNLKSKREVVKKAKRANPRDIEFVCLKNRYGESSYRCGFEYYAQYDYFIPKNDNDFSDYSSRGDFRL